MSHSADVGFRGKKKKKQLKNILLFKHISPLAVESSQSPSLGIESEWQKTHHLMEKADKRIGHDQVVEPKVNCMTILLRVSWNLVLVPPILRPHTEFLIIS